jgi:lipoyl-dependent peroxiredoxin
MSALYVEYGDWRKSSAILAKRIRGICGTVSGERNDPDRNVVIAQPQFLTKVSTMTMLEKVLYTAKTHTTGGRDGGSRSDDRRLDIRLSTPGTSGIGTNPEQLLAAGWSACLMSAMKIEAGKLNITLPAGLATDAEVDLGTANGAYGLAARLHVSLPGMERAVAEALLQAAHRVCPYSRATRGNIDVVIDVV